MAEAVNVMVDSLGAVSGTLSQAVPAGDQRQAGRARTANRGSVHGVYWTVGTAWWMLS